MRQVNLERRVASILRRLAQKYAIEPGDTVEGVSYFTAFVTCYIAATHRATIRSIILQFPPAGYIFLSLL